MPELSPDTRPIETDAQVAIPSSGLTGEIAILAEPPPRAGKKGIGLGGWLALIWLVGLIVICILLPYLPLKKPNAIDVLNPDVGPFKISGHPLGTDDNGRDMLSLCLWGARSSLVVGFGAIGFGVIAGGFLGLVAGYFRGRWDSLLSGLFNVLLAIPQLILALSLVTVFANDTLDRSGQPHPVTPGRRMAVLIFALGVVSIPVLARITRANTLSWSEREFVMAARAQGSKHARVMIREVLPNVLPAMFSIALLGVAVVIVAEGGLSLLGIGVHEPAVSLGQLIALNRGNLATYPYQVFEPIIMIFLTVLSLNYLGDVVRAKFDVREAGI
jgi:peptide/nickel transport system permease protein